MLLKKFVSPVYRRRRSRLDRFGRVVDHRWINASNVDVDRFKYGYDRNGNRTYKENGVIATLSEVYTNDNLNQLASYKLGTLNGGKTDVTGTPTNAQSWDYDAVGNWDSVTTNSTTQTRGANRQNEITSVSGATAPTYDNNGNLTKDENDNRFVWDAWNMLVQVKNSSNTVIATNAFDGLNRKAQVTTSSGTIDRIFSSDWQVLEEKSGSNTKNRYVWSQAYVDALVLRDRDTDSNGTLDERLYPLQDANWNTTGLVNTSGTIVERDTYGPFGVVTFRDVSGASLGASAKDWLFLHQGGQTDSIGNYDFRNRVYSPTLGRWLTNDPLGFDAGDVNFYRYVGNGPGNGLDSFGLETEHDSFPFKRPLPNITLPPIYIPPFLPGGEVVIRIIGAELGSPIFQGKPGPVNEGDFEEQIDLIRRTIGLIDFGIRFTEPTLILPIVPIFPRPKPPGGSKPPETIPPPIGTPGQPLGPPLPRAGTMPNMVPINIKIPIRFPIYSEVNDDPIGYIPIIIKSKFMIKRLS